MRDTLLDGITINFAVRVKSSGDSCPCSIAQIDKYFNLVVQLVERFPRGDKPPKFDPDPPVLRGGLDPRIEGCDHASLLQQFP